MGLAAGEGEGAATAHPAPHTGRAGAMDSIIGATAVAAVAGGPTPVKADAPAQGSRRRRSPGRSGSRSELWSKRARPLAVCYSGRLLRDRCCSERPPPWLGARAHYGPLQFRERAGQMPLRGALVHLKNKRSAFPHRQSVPRDQVPICHISSGAALPLLPIVARD